MLFAMTGIYAFYYGFILLLVCITFADLKAKS